MKQSLKDILLSLENHKKHAIFSSGVRAVKNQHNAIKDLNSVDDIKSEHISAGKVFIRITETGIDIITDEPEVSIINATHDKAIEIITDESSKRGYYITMPLSDLKDKSEILRYPDLGQCQLFTRFEEMSWPIKLLIISLLLIGSDLIISIFIK